MGNFTKNLNLGKRVLPPGLCVVWKLVMAFHGSVPSKDYQLEPIQQNLNYFRGSLSQKFQFLLKTG